MCVDGCGVWGEGGGDVCYSKRRFPSRGLNVWPCELNSFISLGADREERRMVMGKNAD